MCDILQPLTPATVTFNGAAPFTFVYNNVNGNDTITTSANPYTLNTELDTTRLLAVYDANCLLGVNNSGTVSGMAIYPLGVNTSFDNYQTICFGTTYTIDSKEYDEDGEYHDTLVNANGCDSIVTTFLTVEPSLINITQTGTKLEASGSDLVAYFWIDCETNDTLATGKNFEATQNGSYKLVVQSSTCTESSSCFAFDYISVHSINAFQVAIFPNPTTDFIYINAAEVIEYISILDVSGRTMSVFAPNENSTHFDLSNLQAGIYFIQMHSKGEKVIRRIIKK